MSKYQITYACGCEATVDIVGRSSDRDRKAEWLKGQTCYKCKTKKATETAINTNKEFGFSALTGSEKQIAWAETIRNTMTQQASLNQMGIVLMNKINKTCGDVKIENVEEKKRIKAAVLTAANDIVLKNLNTQTTAKWFIDNRENNVFDIFSDEIIVAIQAILAGKPVEAVEIEIAQKNEEIKSKTALELAAVAEATVRAKNAKNSLVAKIDATGRVITVVYDDKNEVLRTIVKGRGFAWWNMRWQCTVDVLDNLENRMAEIGNLLLAAGFNISILDEKTRNKAISGEFKQSTNRTISQSINQGFAISWPYGEDFYKSACKLPGAKWSKPCVLVPADAFSEVQDFAEMYNFRFTESAQKVLDKMNATVGASVAVQIEAKKQEKISTVRPILNAEKVEVLSEFID